MKPTAEQQAAIELFALGGKLVVQAGAGTGKTSTLRLMAANDPNSRIVYLAFNKAIVNEAKAKMPGNVHASTAHGLAWSAVGKRFADRLQHGERMKGHQIGKLLGIDSLQITVGDRPRTLAAGWLASLVMQGIERFCMTADPHPLPHHIPSPEGVDLPHPQTGAPSTANRDLIRAWCADALTAAWEDLSRVDGHLPYRHSHYLKAWQLSGPKIHADVLLVDEAQDLNPCMAAIVDQQDHAARVWVGDSCQQIYSWNGAVDALNRTDADATAWLTQSFRFGPEIADAANRVLGHLETPLRLTGNPAIPSRLGCVDRARVILARTNAEVIGSALRGMGQGQRVAVVGGADEIVRFARSAEQLQSGGKAWHRDLACFDSWAEVVDYCEQDPSGSELSAAVRLVTEWGTDTLIAAFQAPVKESSADLLVSTAHKSKGREWAEVKLANDFPPRSENAAPPTDEETRLLYVAATRAINVLETSHPWITPEG